MAFRSLQLQRQRQHRSSRPISHTTGSVLLFILSFSSLATASSSTTTTNAFLIPIQTSSTTNNNNAISRNYRGCSPPHPFSSSSSLSCPNPSPFAFYRSVTSKISSSNSENTNAPSTDLAKAPTFDGKMVFPIRALTAGLAGHTVAAVYAVINKGYKRGSDDNELKHCEHIGFTRDLNADIQSHVKTHGTRVAYVRALSFAYPQKAAMMEVASRWNDQVVEAGGNAEWAEAVGSDEQEEEDEEDAILEAAKEEEERRRRQMIELMIENAAYEDDDDEFEYDDEDDFTVYPSSVTEAVTEEVVEVEVGGDGDFDDGVISPFASTATNEASSEIEDLHNTTPAERAIFSLETVDSILDEVRPYLISDGGNVSVQSVDMDTKNVYLVLEGACGSCPSSTITMQMGIERVLRENFEDLGDVVQVEDPQVAANNPQELTLEAVEAEVRRVGPAISAMGGVIEILKVDPIGLVELSFRGPNRVQHGLELALLDVPFVKHVRFVN